MSGGSVTRNLIVMRLPSLIVMLLTRSNGLGSLVGDTTRI